MNKKVWMSAVAAYITFAVLDFLVNGVLLKSAYMETASLWRPEGEMIMWIPYVTNAVFAFFFSLIFSKGYEGKGIAEGVRYGLYIGLMFSIPMAYGSYAFMPIPYSLALQWFIYGTLQMIIAGVVVAWVYGMKPKKAAQAS